MAFPYGLFREKALPDVDSVEVGQRNSYKKENIWDLEPLSPGLEGRLESWVGRNRVCSKSYAMPWKWELGIRLNLNGQRKYKDRC